MHRPQTLPAESTIRAAVSLLADSDVRVVAACRRKILEWGVLAAPALRRACEQDDPRLRLRARRLLRSLMLRAWVHRVKRFAATLGENPGSDDVVRGAILLGRLERCEGSDSVTAWTKLQEWGRTLARHVHERSAGARSRLLRAYLTHELGFTGEHVDHYSPRAVSLDTVIEDRAGSATALALIYLAVADAAGMRVSLVRPGDRLLVRVHGARPSLVDPVRGTPLTRAACVRELHLAGVPLAAAALDEISGRDVLSSVFSDLLRVYGYLEDREVCAALERVRPWLADAPD